jgi:hypothetical protein
MSGYNNKLEINYGDNMPLLALLCVACFTISSLVYAAPSTEAIWTLLENDAVGDILSPDELPSSYSVFELNQEALALKLAECPTPSRPGYLPIPTPEGTIGNYSYWNSEVLDAPFAASYPEFKTFQGVNTQNSEQLIRFDNNSNTFKAQIHTGESTFYVSPLQGSKYIVYYSQAYQPAPTSFLCDFNEEIHNLKQHTDSILPFIHYGTIKRTYRLAVAATGEYTIATGGTVLSALRAIATTVNFINGIYDFELGVRFQLVSGTANIIYTNPATDPFTPESGNSAMLSQNQTNTDLVVGNINYDIGHLFHALAGTSNSGSGVAALQATCRSNVKARGVSTATRIGATPINPFFYRIVAHEMGHQFGANHSFNSSCNNARSDLTAYEPGGGSTIMSYAGGCSPNNVQSLADAYFHRISLEEISTFLSGTGGSCGTAVNSGNTIPTANAGPNYIIPRSTPFVLTGVGSDPDGNVLYYCWEQFDRELSVQPPVPTATVGPNFRSFNPTNLPVRFFPRLPDIIANVSPTWEVLPSVSRTLNFSLVVRDAVGGASSDDMTVTVNGSSGPFVVTSPNGGEVRSGTTIVTWNPANTQLAPISAALVDIVLSTNNGLSFPTMLANNTPNDGSQAVVLPSINTTQARILIRAEGNIFLDVSNGPFTITP